jgi:hypothetical protein
LHTEERDAVLTCQTPSLFDQPLDLRQGTAPQVYLCRTHAGQAERVGVTQLPGPVEAVLQPDTRAVRPARQPEAPA